MNVKQLSVWIFFIVFITLTFVLYKNSKTTPVENKAFSSQEACEQATGKKCEYSVCDYIPPGKTVQEICGDRTAKGFYPKE